MINAITPPTAIPALSPIPDEDELPVEAPPLRAVEAVEKDIWGVEEDEFVP
jgi:hypothetical protein